MTMKRQGFDHDGLTLSYLDAGGAGQVVVALHAMWMEARTFEPLAEALAPDWRVVSLDQRGHGLSDHAADYTRGAFVDDITALLDHLGIDGPVDLVGNSLGGTNAFFFAARHPERVRTMVIEESPAEESEPLTFVLPWAGLHPTREALEEKIGERLAWSVAPSFRETARGWTLAFQPADLVQMQKVLNGDFWADWQASRVPALVVRGAQSRAVDGAVLEKMAACRANTRLLTLDAGHVTHHDAPEAFNRAVRHFLETGGAVA